MALNAATESAAQIAAVVRFFLKISLITNLFFKIKS